MKKKGREERAERGGEKMLPSLGWIGAVMAHGVYCPVEFLAHIPN